MATLTETAYYARKTINYGIIAIIALIFLKTGLSAFISYWQKTHPQPPAPPNVLFGKLPKLEFLEKDSTMSALTYKLETVTGGFPKIPDQLKVYFMPLASADFLGFDYAQEQAKKMKFNGEVRKIDDQTYQWSDQNFPERTLTFNIINGNFTVFYDYRLNKSILGEKNLPSKEKAINDVKSLLSGLNLLKSDLEKGKTSISYLRYDLDNNKLLEVNSSLEANFVKISLLRGDVDKLPIYYSDINRAPVVIILSGANDDSKKLISLEYNYQLIDYENSATYPLISSEEAFEKLKAGQGYISSYKGTNQATIRDIMLGYFDSERQQAYLQPIYVFSGDDDFIGYVQAVKEEWIGK